MNTECIKPARPASPVTLLSVKCDLTNTGKRILIDSLTHHFTSNFRLRSCFVYVIYVDVFDGYIYF